MGFSLHEVNTPHIMTHIQMKNPKTRVFMLQIIFTFAVQS